MTNILLLIESIEWNKFTCIYLRNNKIFLIFLYVFEI